MWPFASDVYGGLQLGGGLDGGAVGAGDAADGAEAGTLECTGTGPYDVP